MRNNEKHEYMIRELRHHALLSSQCPFGRQPDMHKIPKTTISIKNIKFREN